jgi:hypothetical protein
MCVCVCVCVYVCAFMCVCVCVCVCCCCRSLLGPVESDPHEDTAYSSLLPLNQTHVFVVYERAGYATITGRTVELRLPR